MYGNAERRQDASPIVSCALILARGGNGVGIGESFQLARNIDARLRLGAARELIVEAAQARLGHTTASPMRWKRGSTPREEADQ